MNDHFKKWLKRLGILFGILLLIIICYIIYVFSSYYRLEDKQILTISGASAEKAKPDMTYRITSGNIGFGAYSDDYSFFMDGGKESRAYSKEAVIENVTSYTTAVAKLHPDFALFQEVDIDGTRSYHIDQRPFILTVLPEKTFHKFIHLPRIMTVLICFIRFWNHMEKIKQDCLLFPQWRLPNPFDVLCQLKEVL